MTPINTDMEGRSAEAGGRREEESLSLRRTLDSGLPTPLPAPRVNMHVRVARMDDIAFMDALQKKHSKQLGFFPRQQMEGYVAAGNVLIAEEIVASGQLPVIRKDNADASSLATSHSPLATIPLGYVAYRDRYLKRDELGVIYQMCVAEAGRRKLVAANLLKSVFERSPRGCKLFCCWCAQDLAANRFWEALGFQAIAFRSGGKARRVGKVGESVSREESTTHRLNNSPTHRARTHIFWQKRVRDDLTPWWYPSETGGGAIKENRLVLPMPMGMRWDEEMPVILPERNLGGAGCTQPVLSAASSSARRMKHGLRTNHGTQSTDVATIAKPSTVKALSRPGFGKAEEAILEPAKEKKPLEKKPREKRSAAKNDPALVKKARDLRDRWFEHVNADANAIAPTAAKYALGEEPVRVAKTAEMEVGIIDVVPMKLLAA